MNNVVELRQPTRLDLPVEKVIARAAEADLESVVIVGYTQDGDEYFCSSQADGAQVIWALQRAIWRLNKICDQLAGED